MLNSPYTTQKQSTAKCGGYYSKCVQAVHKHGKTLGKVSCLYTQSTEKSLSGSNRTTFVHQLSTAKLYFTQVYTHTKNTTFNLFLQVLYPLSTGPINTTNLNKRIVI
jgi:hypothetical protein